jgi:integrase
MSRDSERRKKRRRARRVPSKGVPAALPRAPMASCVPSPDADALTNSMRIGLVDEAATPIEAVECETGVEPITRLDGDELPIEAAFVPGAHSRAEVERLSRVYELATTSPTTRRLYLNRLTLFLSWCAARGVGAMPAHPEVLRLYLVSLAAEHKALSTIDVSVAAISMAHRVLGHAVPMSDALRITLRSLRRTLGLRGTPTTSISLAMLRQIVASCDHDPHGIRDRALILVTYFAGLRRAETAGLNREGANREERGYRLTLDSEPRDRTDAPTPLSPHADQNICPVLALDAWLRLPAMWVRGLDAAPVRGALFVGLHQGRRQRLRIGERLAPNDVDRIVKRRAIAAGLNPAGLSAVSLRAGFYADAAHGDTRVIA